MKSRGIRSFRNALEFGAFSMEVMKYFPGKIKDKNKKNSTETLIVISLNLHIALGKMAIEQSLFFCSMSRDYHSTSLCPLLFHLIILTIFIA